MPDMKTGHITVRTSSGMERYAAQSSSDRPGYAIATLQASNRHLDAMAFSRGRFLIQTITGNLVMPTWPELTAVIEDCRAG